MNAAVYQDIALNWSPEGRRDWTLKTITLVLLLIFTAAGVGIYWVDLPEKERTVVEVPERITKFIGERPKPERVVRPPVQKEIAQVKPLPLPEPVKPPKVETPVKQEVEKTVEPAKVKVPADPAKLPKTDKQRQAAEVANQKGLQTIRDGLADLLDDSEFEDVMSGSGGGGAIVHSGNGAGSKASSPLGDGAGSALAADLSGAGAGSRATGKATFVAPVKDSQLVAMNSATVESGFVAADKTSSSAGQSAQDQRRRGSGRYREEEELALMFDQNKGKLQSLYDRERRTNPGLKGKVVIELTIEPNGEVSSAKILSSELDHPKLEKRLLSRVKKFSFSNRDVDTVTVIYPIEFLPS